MLSKVVILRTRIRNSVCEGINRSPNRSRSDDHKQETSRSLFIYFAFRTFLRLTVINFFVLIFPSWVYLILAELAPWSSIEKRVISVPGGHTNLPCTVPIFRMSLPRGRLAWGALLPRRFKLTTT